MTAAAPMSAKELDLLEKFGGSDAPRLVADSDASLKGSRVTDAFGNPPGAAADLQLGQVQAGGVRSRRRTRRKGRKAHRRRRSTRSRNRLSMNARAQNRRRH